MASDVPLLHGHTGWTKCRSCGASIVFAIMYTSGKNAPFQRDDAGEWVLENGVAKNIGRPPAQPDMFAGEQPTRWTSHFARCEQASSWRRKK